MTTGFQNWSRTPGSNANATYTWAEGMAPSSVNDSARGIMSDLAQWRDDIGGAITTGGSSTAYTVTSYSTYASLSALNGMLIAFTPNATSTNAVGVDVTLQVDGLTAKPIRMQPSVALPSGTLILGSVYIVAYNSADGVFYLQNMTTPYAVPLGGLIDYAGSTAPNSAFALPTGQAISRTTYATLFSLISTTYGTGDGSTTFNLPDLTGRVVAMKEASATRLTSTYFSGNSTALGAVGGSESTQLVATQLPAITVSVSGSQQYNQPLADPTSTAIVNTGAGNEYVPYWHANPSLGKPSISATGSATNTGSVGNGSGAAAGHRTVQPTIVLNKLMRVI